MAYAKVSVSSLRSIREFSVSFPFYLCRGLVPTVFLDGMGLDVPKKKPEGVLGLLTGIKQM